MPLIYGEGDNALRRLQKGINERYGADAAASLTAGDQIGSLGLCLNSAPVIKSGDFVGRALEISTIHDLLRPDQAPVEQRRVILGGIGGMGKTQLAIAYARQHQRSYTSVLWLNATTELTLHASFRSLAPGVITAEELARIDDGQLLVRIHQWLSQTYNTQWLLVFDNYDNPEQFNIDSFCPNTGHGSIVITTRLPDLVSGQQVRVPPLQAIDDGLAILQTRSGRLNTKEDRGAHRLAERLAGLPLALVTAGAYLRKSVITFRQYLDAYDQRWKVDPRRTLQLPDYRDRTLYTTWDLTYRKLRADDLEAAQMLQLLAYFDNQDVWHSLLRAGLSDQAPAWLQTILSEDGGLSSVMGTLVDYCLVEVRPVTESYSMHNCVHDWMLGELNREIDPQLYWYAFDCVAAIVDGYKWGMLDEAKYGRVSLHAVRLTHHRFSACDEFEHGLLERLDNAARIATMLREQAQLSAAAQMYEREVAGHEKVMGLDHTTTLDAVHNLGAVYHDQGKLSESEQMYRRALVGCEKALGQDHTSTLITVDNLGTLYRSQGKLERAGQMFERALAGYERTLGSEHPSTLYTVNTLVLVYYDQGRFDKAEQMNNRVLKICAGSSPEKNHQHPLDRAYVRALRRSFQVNSIVRPFLIPRLLHLMKKWKDDKIICQEVARAMVYHGDEKNAQEAFRYSVRRVHQQRADYHVIYCDGCSQLMAVETGLHICRQCMETDLCDQCMAGYIKGETVRARCIGHNFFHVDKAALIVLHSTAVDIAAEMMAWIDRAIAEYTPAGNDYLENDWLEFQEEELRSIE